jgi:hypothetical protein
VIEREATRRSNLQSLAMKRATRLCRKGRRVMRWHVVTRHHGPVNLFCIRTHPFRPFCLWTQPLGSKETAVHHQVALDLDFDFFSIQVHSLLLRCYNLHRKRQLVPTMSNQGPQLRHKASEPATGKVSHQRGSASEIKCRLPSFSI